jgi:hypothetical protein
VSVSVSVSVFVCGVCGVPRVNFDTSARAFLPTPDSAQEEGWTPDAIDATVQLHMLNRHHQSMQSGAPIVSRVPASPVAIRRTREQVHTGLAQSSLGAF